MPRDWDDLHRQPPKIPRPELPSLRGIADADARLFLLFYLRSNKDEDQEEARKRCATYKVDFEQARLEARRTP